MKIDRIFLLEPNLVKSTGHPVEYCTNIVYYCNQNKIKLHCVGNVKIDSQTKKKTYAIPQLHNSCFEELEDSGKVFSHDLTELDKYYKFNQTDLVLIATSYTNEILGIAKYIAKSKKTILPYFVLWFHQLFPPTLVFEEGINPYFQGGWVSRLADAFKAAVSRKEISFWTTPSLYLNKSYSQIAGCSVGILPNPCDFFPQVTHEPSLNDGTLRYAFLGDGRYEKGLFVLLMSILESKDKANFYFIQDIDLRGYSNKELIALTYLRETLATWENIKFISSPVTVNEFRKYIESSDVILLPYHPLSYDRRVSSVYIQSIQHGKPVLASKNTWIEEELLKYGTGISFEYDISNVSNSTISFVKARKQMERDVKFFRQNAKEASIYYINQYSTKNFFDTLIKSLR